MSRKHTSWNFDAQTQTRLAADPSHAVNESGRLRPPADRQPRPKRLRRLKHQGEEVIGQANNHNDDLAV
jgi:hypothetical protein